MVQDIGIWDAVDAMMDISSQIISQTSSAVSAMSADTWVYPGGPYPPTGTYTPPDITNDPKILYGLKQDKELRIVSAGGYSLSGAISSVFEKATFPRINAQDLNTNNISSNNISCTNLSSSLGKIGTLSASRISSDNGIFNSLSVTFGSGNQNLSSILFFLSSSISAIEDALNKRTFIIEEHIPYL